MRFAVVSALALGLVAFPARAEKAASFHWDHEGYASLLAAAKDAKDHGRRLLLGLSGGDT